MKTEADKQLSAYFRKNREVRKKKKQIVKHLVKEAYKEIGVKVLVGKLEVNKNIIVTN